MAITTELVGKLGGGASWQTQTIGPLTASGNYTSTDIATITSPPSGKTKIGVLKVNAVRQGGYPTNWGISVKLKSTAPGEGSMYGTWSNNSTAQAGAIFQISVGDTVQVTTQSNTGSVSVSGTIEWLEK